METWEYCAVYLTIYAEGTGGPPQELLEVKLPGTQRTSVSNPYGLVGLLNQLGAESWELVDVESATFYLKRPIQSNDATR